MTSSSDIMSNGGGYCKHLTTIYGNPISTASEYCTLSVRIIVYYYFTSYNTLDLVNITCMYMCTYMIVDCVCACIVIIIIHYIRKKRLIAYHCHPLSPLHAVLVAY